MWSVVVCEPGRVNDCSSLLRERGHTTFLPLLREHRRTLDKQKVWRVTSYDRPLFGPYLFINADNVNYLTMRYVAKILNSTVPDPVISALQAAADADGVIVGRHLPRVTNGRCIDFVAKRYDVCNLIISTEEVRGIIEDVSKVEKTGFVTVLMTMLGRECRTELHYTKIGNVIGRLPPSGLNRRERRKQLLAFA